MSLTRVDEFLSFRALAWRRSMLPLSLRVGASSKPESKDPENKSLVATAVNAVSSLRSGRLYPAVPQFKRSAYQRMAHQPRLQLFAGPRACKCCSHRWQGYSHGFARGHIVMEKGARFLLIPDDIWYCFPDGTSFDIAAIFFELGWRDIETCPVCASVRLEQFDYAKSQTEDVQFEGVEAADFCRAGDSWRLTDRAHERYVQPCTAANPA
jgi:hypothetical protein